jgi:hypothetical protein
MDARSANARICPLEMTRPGSEIISNLGAVAMQNPQTKVPSSDFSQPGEAESEKVLSARICSYDDVPCGCGCTGTRSSNPPGGIIQLDTSEFQYFSISARVDE